MTVELLRQLENRGYAGRIVSVRRLRDLQEAVEGHYSQGLLAEEFYRERLVVFTSALPDSLPDAESLIVVAVPEPQVRITFTWNGKPVPVTVPPTFYPEQQINKQVEDLLAGILGPAGFRVAQAVLPKKLLAVHSGLGTYGRNNLCYVPGMGSFHRLVALCSDLPCPEDDWQELKMMERCEKCVACLRRCPSGAITSERFLIRAERCLTFHNEKLSDVAFPAWIDPSWHNCLVGCFHCQTICPENRDFLDQVTEGPEFSSEETAFLLEGVPHDRLPPAILNKLEQFDMMEILEFLPRNLSVLLNCDSGLS